ncbi:hypothetical protein [Pseudomonas sp. Z18(2022)]|uniref:hypothetical protein n=1 Tax=Pseudomonas sp. Z18(2022) TaxID=2983410 RepID=UPI002E801279|nr:hypothetical protein [Pseudomonas sp. Z18(2022)]
MLTTSNPRYTGAVIPERLSTSSIISIADASGEGYQEPPAYFDYLPNDAFSPDCAKKAAMAYQPLNSKASGAHPVQHQAVHTENLFAVAMVEQIWNSIPTP